MRHLFRRMFTSFSRRPTGVAIILTAIWLIGCVWYVSNNIG